jgi:hypothetical protein
VVRVPFWMKFAFFFAAFMLIWIGLVLAWSKWMSRPRASDDEE